MQINSRGYEEMNIPLREACVNYVRIQLFFWHSTGYQLLLSIAAMAGAGLPYSQPHPITGLTQEGCGRPGAARVPRVLAAEHLWSGVPGADAPGSHYAKAIPFPPMST
jgi:hypothetical protein